MIENPGHGDSQGKTRKQWRDFEEAREFVRGLGLKNYAEWRAHCKSGRRPTNIPSAPMEVYKDKWRGMGDWLGTGRIRLNGWLPYEEAREVVRNLGLRGAQEWQDYCKSGQKPDNIPATPERTYKDEWRGMGDWTGTGYIYNREYRDFKSAREFVRGMGLKSQEEWQDYCKSGQKPDDIPGDPRKVYKDEWKEMGDWLGTGRTREWRPFEEAREFVRSLGLKGQDEWYIYCRSGQKPDDIPVGAERTYKDEWRGMGDWLGTGYIANRKRKYRPFEEARVYVRELGLKGQKEWYTYCKSGRKPDDIPANSNNIYKSEWRGWQDWLGSVNVWNKVALLAFLEDLRPILAQLEYRELYAILKQGGKLQKFKLAMNAGSTLSALQDLKENNGQAIEAGLKDISEEALEEESDEPSEEEIAQEEFEEAMLSQGTDEEACEEEEKQKEKGLLGLASPEALRAVDALKMVCGIDEEAAEYMVCNRIMALWESLINNGEEAVNKALDGNGEQYFTEIKRRFLEERNAVNAVLIPDGWAFKDDQGNGCVPTPMQRRVAWQVQERRRVGNWSGVGAGKTLSAILASRVIDSHVTLIVANNATVREDDQETEKQLINNWRRQILNAYPERTGTVIYGYDEIMEGRTLSPDKYNYIILNYEKFQGKHDTRGLNRARLLNELLEICPDFIVLDEVQFVKQRYDKPSQRREALIDLIGKVAEAKPSLCVLGMSATPVINNLQETKKLLEVVTGEALSDVSVTPTIDNVLTHHRLLMLNGTRYRPRYETEMPPIILSEMHNELLEDLRKGSKSILSTEQVLLPVKLEMIRPYLRKSTLIYTHYVDEMIEPICQYLESIGLTSGVYTGLNKSGLEPFLRKEVDVLVGSSPVGTGLDGLQKVCDRIAMPCLPWTSAGYEQVIGRVRRQGSNFKKVEVIIPQVILEYKGDIWSWDRRRLELIKYKHTLSDCVLDGIIPQTLHINQQEFLKQSRESLEKWVERVNADGLFTMERSPA